MNINIKESSIPTNTGLAPISTIASTVYKIKCLSNIITGLTPKLFKAIFKAAVPDETAKAY